MTDLLLELGCEDLPARYVMPLAEALSKGVAAGLAKRGVAAGEAKILATPRRLAVLVNGVASQQPDQNIERLGPALTAAFKDGKPTPAALGFAKSCGVEFAALGQKDGKLHFARSAPGKPTAELLPEIFEETLKQMDELVPKRMRWGSGEETFVRPVQWLCCLLGADVVPLQRFGLKSGRTTYGHRFHAPAAIELKSPADYVSQLQAAKVWADFDSRKAEIRRQVEALGSKLGGHALINDSLLDEVTTLVEWPVAIAGQFEQRFLELPPEVIVATVETNQRYFTVFQDEHFTRLTQHFITICNIESRDVHQVISGNERVVRPRLADGMFFWTEDQKKPLSAYSEQLTTVTYQKGLGSLADKVQRIENLAVVIANKLSFGSRIESVRRVAALCKNDLVTKMVYEFPELQGRIGGHYARMSGETKEVWRSVSEHYLPNSLNSLIPQDAAGLAVALADKIDSLAGNFALGQKPTASKDPFALRRAALGVLRICIEADLSLDLRELVEEALRIQPNGKRDAVTLIELVDFILDRLPGYFEGLPAEMYAAVRSLGVYSLRDFNARVQALRGFWALPEAKNLAAAHKRVRNILKQAGDIGAAGVDAKLFEHDAERALHAQMARLGSGGDYGQKFAALATLRAPVDQFFEAVMVNAENPAVRANRLALLRQLDAACREVADISCLPG